MSSGCSAEAADLRPGQMSTRKWMEAWMAVTEEALSLWMVEAGGQASAWGRRHFRGGLSWSPPVPPEAGGLGHSSPRLPPGACRASHQLGSLNT